MIKKINSLVFINDEFFVFPIIRKIKNKEEYRRIFSNFVSLGILQAANYLLPLITLPYLVRVLGPEKFGLIAFAQVFIWYFNTLTDYGFNLTATREISINCDNKEKVSEIFSSVMIIKAGLLVLSFIIMTIVVFSFEKFREDWVIYYLTFGIVVGQALFPVWFFQGMEQMRYITILNITAKIIFTVMIFVLVHRVSDYIYVPLLNSVGFIIAGIIGIWVVYKNFNVDLKNPGFEQIKHQLKQGWHIFISTLSISLYRNFNTFALGVFTNNLIVGYYSIAEKILFALQNVQVIVGQALFPYFSKKFNKLSVNESFNFIFKYFSKVLLFYLVFFVIVFLFSNHLIRLISGKILTNTILDLKILSFVIVIGGLNYYFGVLGLIPLGYSNIFMKSVLIAGIFNMVVATILSIVFKDLGTSISLVISELLLLYLIYKQMIKILSENEIQ